MQKEYVEGKRGLHQKPFSMFFLCGTICGLAYYFINVAVRNLYNVDNTSEANFFRHYFVLMQAVMMPLYCLLTWLIFYSKRRNYAEVLVMMLYLLSLVFLVFILINAVRLLFPHYENKYVEVAFLLFYNTITHLNFFEGAKWLIVLKTILLMGLCYAASQVVSQFVINYLSH